MLRNMYTVLANTTQAATDMVSQATNATTGAVSQATQLATGAVSQATQLVTESVSNVATASVNLTSGVLTSTPSLSTLSNGMLNISSSFFPGASSKEVITELQQHAQQDGLKKTLAKIRMQQNTWTDHAISAMTAFMSNERYYEDCMEFYSRVYYAADSLVCIKLSGAKKEELELLDKEYTHKTIHIPSGSYEMKHTVSEYGIKWVSQKKNDDNIESRVIPLSEMINMPVPDDMEPIYMEKKVEKSSSFQLAGDIKVQYQIPTRLTETQMWGSAIEEILAREERLSKIHEEISVLDQFVGSLRDKLTNSELSKNEKQGLAQELYIYEQALVEAQRLLRNYSYYKTQQKKDIWIFREYCHYASKSYARTAVGQECKKIEEGYQRLKSKAEYNSEKMAVTDELFEIYAFLNDLAGKREYLLSTWKGLISKTDENFSIDGADNDKNEKAKQNLKLVRQAEVEYWDEQEFLDVSHLGLEYADDESRENSLNSYLQTLEFNSNLLDRFEKVLKSAMAKYPDDSELKEINKKINSSRELLAREKEVLSVFAVRNENEVRYDA